MPRGIQLRIALLAMVAAISCLAIFAHGPIPQDTRYHQFADQRSLFGVPNFWNVSSNLGFLLSGVVGIFVLRSGRANGTLPSLRAAFFAFFAGSILVAVGSSVYHLAPNNDTLVFDRLPMTIAFMAFFCLILGEHIHPDLGRFSLAPLLVIGSSSVFYWWFTESKGHGDLRPYVIVQYLPIVLIPLIIVIFPSRLTRVRYVWGLLAIYALAKVSERFDLPLYGWLGISGHTLKHVLAACGMFLLVIALRARRISVYEKHDRRFRKAVWMRGVDCPSPRHGSVERGDLRATLPQAKRTSRTIRGTRLAGQRHTQENPETLRELRPITAIEKARDSVVLNKRHLEDFPMTSLCHPLLSVGMNRAGWTSPIVSGGLAMLLLAGCSTLQSVAVNKLGDTLSQESSVFSSDDDPQLVGDALPFSLKLMESVLAESPRHRGLLLGTLRGFTEYAYGWVDQPAREIESVDPQMAAQRRDRARKLYLRARGYGLRSFEVLQPGFEAKLRAAPRDAVRSISVRDVPLLYWTASAWGLAISVSKDQPELIADLPIVEALIDRAIELDDAFGEGAIHVFLINYEPNRAGGIGDPLVRARHHFDRAVELSHGLLASPYVTFAESISLQTQNRAEFETLLHRALAIDPDARPASRLENYLAQQHARWLLTHADDLFVGPPEGEKK